MTRPAPDPPVDGLDRAIALRRTEDGWCGEVPPTWTPNGAAHGGVLFALVVNGMQRVAPHPHLLTATAHYLRPTPAGPVDLATQVVRDGRAHATVEATLAQHDRPCVRVIAVFGTLPAEPACTDLAPPPLPAPDECIPMTARAQGGFLPSDYPSDLDIRLDPRVGWLRGERSGRPEVAGWGRLSDGRPHDLVSLALMADAFPPPIFDVMPTSYVPTLELTVHMRGLPSGQWVRGRFDTKAVNRPYVEEDGVLFDERGRLVAMSRQLAVVNSEGGHR